MKLKLIAILFFFFSSNTLAMLCPKNFNSIEIGDPIAKVKLQCGAPDFEKDSSREPNVPQEWNYYVKPDPSNDQTLKMTIAFVENKVVNITVNNQSLVSTTFCGNEIDTGNTQEQIQSVCGKPIFINKGNTAQSSPPAIQVIEYTYSSSPPVTLVFENGIFTGKK